MRSVASKANRLQQFCRPIVPCFHQHCSEYAEAAEAESRKDFIHKLKIAMKELSETRVWLKIIGESEYVQISKLGPLINEAEELSRILAASVITARGRRD